MKTKEELNALKKEVEELNERLKPLSEEELAHVVGGMKMVVEDLPKIEEDDSWLEAFWKAFLKTLG